MGDSAIDLKAALPQSWAPPNLAVGLRATIPTGDEERGLGSEEPRFMFYAVASQRVREVTGHLQALIDLESRERPQYGVNGALDVSLRPDFSVLLGVNALAQPGRARPWR